MKSDSAFRTIGEAAEIIGVPQHVLRFWETQIKQIQPLKRRGRRYYRPEDLEILKQVKTLLRTEGYTVKGVQKTLNELVKKELSALPQPDLFQSHSDEAMPIAFDSATQVKLEEILGNLYQARNRLAAILHS